MKSLARLITALSLAGSCFAGVAMAQTGDGADATGGAKGLFFEQLSHPADNLNTGIQYWIELHHDGQLIHATNKTAFHTGDKIRFHVRPNIDGFAYIMLKSGSRGEQAVLFPSKGRDENNKITRGKEIVLPDDGMLSFDANPGTEKLTLLVSRKPIDTESYLSAATATTSSGPPPDADTNSKAPTEASSKEPQVAVAEPPRLVAMASSGSKDLIPNQVLVAYLPSSSGVPESVKAAAAKASKQAASTNSKQQEVSNQKGSSGNSSSNANANSNSSSSTSKVSSKTNSTTKSGSSSSPPSSSSSSATSLGSIAQATDSSKGKTSRGSRKGTAGKGSKHQSVATANTHATEAGTSSERGAGSAGLVTVVFKNPDSVLAADISLEHL